MGDSQDGLDRIDRIEKQMRRGGDALLDAVAARLAALGGASPDTAAPPRGLEAPIAGDVDAAPIAGEVDAVGSLGAADSPRLRPQLLGRPEVEPQAPAGPTGPAPGLAAGPGSAGPGSAGAGSAGPGSAGPGSAGPGSAGASWGSGSRPAGRTEASRPLWVSNVIASLIALSVLLVVLGVLTFY